MILSDKIRLCPTDEQEKLFRKFCNTARFVYNECLSYKIREYEDNGYSCNVQDLIKHIQDLKYSNEFSWISETPESVSKQAIKDLDKAYKSFFRRGYKGFPKYKSKRKAKLSFYQRSDNLHMVGDMHIKITGIKSPVRVKNPLLTDKFLDPRVSFDGKFWFLTYGIELNALPASESKQVLGVDLGIKNLAVCSDGREYRNINKDKTVLKLERRLKRLQRRVSRKYEINKVNGKFVKTNNILKLETEIRLIHRRLKNIRNTYIHQVTFDLVRTKPGKIVIEDLNVSGMMKNKYLADSIRKQCFYLFRQYLTYKCEFYGVQLVVADRFFASSKICSCCGNKRKFLSLSERTYRCSECGTLIDRDYNASLNLRNYALTL